jgi:hypothetical protein
MFRRFVLLTAGLTLVLVLALAAFASWFLAGDGVRTSLESQATKWLGQSVRIGSASAQIFPRPAITLHDVRAGDPARLVLADVRVSTGLKPLWSRRIEDAEISIADTRIEMPLPFTLPLSGDTNTAAESSSGGIQVVSIRQIALRNITIASRGREITVSADSSLSSAHLNLDRFTATAGKTSLVASGLVELSPRLDAQLLVKAEHVDVDDLIALAGAFAPRTEPALRTTASTTSLPGRIVARVSAETARASGVDVRQFATTVVAQGNRVTLSPVSFQLFGGMYHGMLDVDAQPDTLRATIRAQIDDLDVAQLAAFGGVADTITGRLSGTGTFTGRGADVASAVAAATGEGKVTIANGVLKRLGLVRTVVLFFGRPAPNAPAATDNFDRIDASFGLVRQVVAASALSLHSRDVDLVGQGTLAIPTKALDGHMDLSLSEELSAQAGTDLARFTREGNRVLLPAVISGTLDAPHVTIDAGAAVRRGLRNEVQRRLKGILGGLVPGTQD